MSIYQTIERLKNHIAELMKRYELLKAEVLELRSLKSNLESLLKEKDDQIEELKLQEKPSKLTEFPNGHQKLKGEVNELIKEVEKCIELINN